MVGLQTCQFFQFVVIFLIFTYEFWHSDIAFHKFRLFKIILSALIDGSFNENNPDQFRNFHILAASFIQLRMR